MSQPLPAPYGATPAPPQAWIGDIGVSSTHLHLPRGSHPIRGARWTVMDQVHVTEKTSQTGIILAAVLFLFLCFFSLFFLLMKESVLSGAVQVTVTGEGFQHTAYVPVGDQYAITHVHQLVTWAQSMS